MKPLVVLGWILFGIEALLVLSMLVTRNVGDDAAGRGVGTVFGLVLGALLLVAVAGFVWGQRGGPRLAFYAGLGAMAVPAVFLLFNVVGNRLGEVDRARSKSRGARFTDPAAEQVAHLVAAGDTGALRARLAQGGVDFTVRNRMGRTLLGFAVERATDWEAGPGAVDAVRLLLEAGAKPVPNAIEPVATPRNTNGHLLTYWVVGRGGASAEVLDLLLAHGGEVNPVDWQGQPILFSTDMTLPVLEVLAQHGADLRVLDTTRTDRPRWSAPMLAAVFKNWDQVLFYLDHGADADYTAPDGQNLRALVEEKAREGEAGEAFLAVRRRLGLP